MAWREQLTVGDLTVEGDLIASPSRVRGLGPLANPITYYVDRNIGASGEGGQTWERAFKTIGEAITQVNTDYTNSLGVSGGRNREIVIGEGWYSEVGMTLSASDVTIRTLVPGNDHTVLYGSLTAGGFDAGSLVPALTITGSNNTINGLSFMNSASSLYPCVTIGALAGAAYQNALLNCKFVRDVADAYTYAVQVYDLEGTTIYGCEFSQSAMTAGIHVESDGVVNPVNVRLNNNLFVGTPIGIHQVAGHNTMIQGNSFIDASDDRADTIDNPCVIDATSAFMTNNFAPQNTLAEFNGGAAGVELANICSDSAAANYPA